eukprot:568386-Hanusia_phi.AAC.2
MLDSRTVCSVRVTFNASVVPGPPGPGPPVTATGSRDRTLTAARPFAYSAIIAGTVQRFGMLPILFSALRPGTPGVGSPSDARSPILAAAGRGRARGSAASLIIGPGCVPAAGCHWQRAPRT